MNEIKITTPDVKWQAGIVEFDNFNEYKEQASEIASFINSFSLTDENIQTAKKMLASSRKIVNALDKKRIGIKKDLLKSYEIFENQIKELKAIIDEADVTIRNQVKEIEEKEREEKRLKIKEMWDKRIQQYEVQIIPNLFDRWLTPQHLNKSMSMKKVEEDMVKFLEQRQQDLEALNTMDDKSELIAEYFKTLSLTETMVNHREKIEREELAKKAARILDADDEDEEMEIFIVTGKKDIAMTKLLLNSNGIKYRITKGI